MLLLWQNMPCCLHGKPYRYALVFSTNISSIIDVKDGVILFVYEAIHGASINSIDKYFNYYYIFDLY